MNEQEFRKQASEQGYDEPVVKEWKPYFQDVFHTHDKHVMLLVLKGELELILEKQEMSFQEGQHCNLVSHTRHSEKTGCLGATTLLALK